MFTDAQLLYLTEVLGTEAGHYRTPSAAPARAVPRAVVVWTPKLGPEERALLTKVLASVGLTDFAHVEDGEAGACRHLLRFDGAALGRSEADGGVTWAFHDLRTMLGASAEVTARKREVWTLLQEFRREV